MRTRSIAPRQKNWITAAAITMPARQRERHSSAPRKVFTFSLEYCSRSAGISVHVALENPFTMSRNMQVMPALLKDLREGADRLQVGPSRT